MGATGAIPTPARIGLLALVSPDDYFRHGAVVHHPAITHAGHKAMLTNGQAGSGGDAFPWFFREMEAGVLIGERTWGG